MIAGKAHEQVGVDDLTFVPLALVLGQPRKRSAGGRAAAGERVCSLAVRYTPKPIQSGPACLCEKTPAGTTEHNSGLHATAVIALIVVLAD